MKKNEVVIPGIYVMKVSGKIAPVRVLAKHEPREVEGRPRGSFGRSCAIKVSGWYEGVNLRTNRPVRIHSAAKLRYPLHPCGATGCGQYTTDTSKLCKAHRAETSL